MQKITEAQKRSVKCPTCAAKPGRACRGSRQPGANTFGGGWGGPPDRERAHDERRAAYVDKVGKADVACRACAKTLAQCNDSPECEETNNCEHDIPGYRMHTVLTPASAED